MRIKTSELTGAALDWAVAKCEGNHITFADGTGPAPAGTPSGQWEMYSTNWTQGGPIIDCVDMQFWKWGGSPREEMQCATLPVKEEHGTRRTTYFGESKLVAGLRAYVASKLGDEVEIPDELG